MSLVDKMPLSFWEGSQNIYKKYKRGAMTLDDCFDRRRELSIQHIEKMKNRIKLIIVVMVAVR